MFCCSWVQLTMDSRRDETFVLLQKEHTCYPEQLLATQVSSQGCSLAKVELSDYLNYLRQCEALFTLYEDQQFPPSQGSLGDFHGKQKNIQWKRLSQIIHNPVLFQEGQKLHSIIWSNPDDSYFLPTIAALSTRPYLLQGMFGRHSISHGIYTVFVKINGALTQVVVDDLVPVYKQSIIFTKPEGRSIWKPILEKAWAKVNGNYQTIRNGFTHLVLQRLNLAPCEIYYTKTVPSQDQESLQRIIVNAVKNKLPICANSMDTIQISQAGLKPSHTYVVIGICNITTTAQQNLRLVSLLHSSNIQKLKGSYGEYRQNKSPVQKQKIKLDPSQFYLPLSDFMRMFSNVYVSKNQEGFNYSYYNFQIYENKSQYFSFQISQSKLSLGIYYKSQNRKAIMVLARTSANISRFKYIGSKSQINNYNQLIWNSDQILPQGTYIIYIKIQQLNRQSKIKPAKTNLNSIGISIYSKQLPLISQLKKFKQQNPQFLKSVLFSRAQLNKKIIQKHPLIWLSQCFMIDKGDFGYVAAYSDPAATRRLRFVIEQENFLSQNLVLKKPFKKSAGVKQVVLKPGERLMILCRLVGKLNGIKFPPLKIKERVN